MTENWVDTKCRQFSIADEITRERDRQDDKFGEQWEMPLVAVPSDHALCAEIAADWKRMNGATAEDFAGMLLEEVYEALAESDPARMREELIQVCAVVMKMIEKIDREAQ